MRKFIAILFSNRFGIVLATLNVCYLAKVIFAKPLIVPSLSEKIFLSINAPGLFFSYLPASFAHEFFPLLDETQIKLQVAFVVITFFMVLQWLFIAWIARTIAQKLRPKEF